MSTSRDTQFLGFAQALWREIATTIDDVSTEENNIVDGCAACSMKPEKLALFIEPLIARRAYDLAYHSVHELLLYHNEQHSLLFNAAMEADDQIEDHVPDMPELPEEPQ